MESAILQHFRPSERRTLEFFTDLIEKVETTYAPVLTHFLNPREQYILQTLVRTNSTLSMQMRGGPERSRALIYPTYFTPSSADFELCYFALDYPQKFARLEHPQVLGSLLSLGFRRDFLGDVLNDGAQFQFVTTKEVGTYIVNHLEKVGNVRVKVREIDESQKIENKHAWEEEKASISSLRLDNLISCVYNISRSRAKNLIDAGKVWLNYTLCEKADIEISPHDQMSVRGFGRIRLKEIEGVSKKGKTRISYKVLRNR